MSLIKVSNLTFGYDGSSDNVFDNVSFQIDSAWKLGFIGRNGKGKTTLLNLLMGKYEYGGSIESSVDFKYFPVEVQKNMWKSNVIDVMEREFPDYELWKVVMELNLLDMEADILYRRYETLSLGERTRVMLAYLFSSDNSFLLLDEPTNHLDIEAREAVKKYLKEKKGFILVSHEKDFLDDCVNHILSLNRSTITVTKGNFSLWWENKKRQDIYEIGQNERLKKDIKRLEEASARTRQWADKAESRKIGYNPVSEDRSIGTRSYIGEKSRRMQQQRKNMERRQQRHIGEKRELLKDIEENKELKLFPLKYHKEILVNVNKASIAYGDRRVCDNISFTVNNGDIVLLRGGNGSGKSSIIKMILGEVRSVAGNCTVSSGVKISYVPQDTSFLKGGVGEYAQKQGVEVSLIMNLLRQLDFSREQLGKNMEDYSQGQKKKVLLAASLCSRAHLYIWDEPLNYIDIFSRIQLQELIKKYKPNMILVEHDKSFGDNVSNKIVSLGAI